VIVHNGQQLTTVGVKQEDQANIVAGIFLAAFSIPRDLSGQGRINAQGHGAKARHNPGDVVEPIKGIGLLRRDVHAGTRPVDCHLLAQLPKRHFRHFNELP